MYQENGHIYTKSHKSLLRTNPLLKMNDNILFLIYSIFLIIIQYLKDKKAAAPAFIHYSSESFDGNSKSLTKLVECPVVLNVPALLYINLSMIP